MMFQLVIFESHGITTQALYYSVTPFLFSRLVIDLLTPFSPFILQAEGQTILHIASLNGDENMIRTLYLARANATIPDNEGTW